MTARCVRAHPREAPRTGQESKARPEANTHGPNAPASTTRRTSLTVYTKPGKASVVCFAGCDDALDILPALGMTVADLYDERRAGRGNIQPRPQGIQGTD